MVSDFIEFQTNECVSDDKETITGPAEAIFYWSGLYETFLCNNLNEVVVAQRAREGFALAQLGGSGACSPGKFWIFGRSRMQF